VKSRKLVLDIILFIVVCSLCACSTKKNTFTRRSFHNLTSHYNGYWNARDKMRTTVEQMRHGGVDNYTAIIPLEYYGTKAETQSMKPNLDGSIEKSFLMIRRHSMIFEKEERIKWIDDCYMVIGMCYFYEKDYSNARRTFQYILKTYEDTPLKNYVQLWLARTYVCSKEFEKAQIMLETIQPAINNFEVSRTVQKEFPVVYAEYYLYQSKYDEAISYLEKTIETNKFNKTLKQRSRFILGQIYQSKEEFAKATKYFEKSSKGNNFYINFNSKIRIAQCYDTGNGDNIVKTLTKMLKEEKNAEFRDQIYYALADVCRRKGDTTCQINNLKNCVASSVSNNYQKAIGANDLANLYFNKKLYIESQPYYDTTIQFLPYDYPNYMEIKERAYILTDLVKCLTTVQTEDSLQRMAKMDPKERDAMIKKIIDKLKEEERIRQQLEQQRQQSYSSSIVNQYENQQIQNRLGVQSSWYFYNTQTVSLGITEFKRRWGNRKLEDLWFLQNKQSFSWEELGEIASDTTSSDTIQYVTDVMDPKYYTQYLPLTDELMVISNNRIEKSLYDAGFIATERLGDYNLSNECFASLIKRFPESKYLLLSYYMQYMNCTELSEADCMSEMKGTIIAKFPESDYAKLLQDPSYIVVMKQRMDAAKNLYADIYNSYESGMYDLMQIYAEEGLALKDPDYAPRFMYMSAMADIGKKLDDTVAISKLETLIHNYPSAEITPLAQQTLDMLKPKEEVVLDSATIATMEQERIEKEKFEQEIEMYKYRCNANYFYVLVLNVNKANVKAISTRVSDYVLRYHKFDNLSSKNLVLNDSCEMITVSSFPDCNKALDFYENAMEINYIYSGLPPDAYYHFVISQDNYSTFYKNKNIEAYQYFFDNKVLSKRKETNN